MKIITIIATLIFLPSCSNNDDCIAVRYGEAFVTEAGNIYCFEDGNELQVDDIINAFCPCDAICVWEGQMEVYMTWSIDGTSYDFKHNSAETIIDSTMHLPFDISVSSDNIIFEEECDDSNPSPEILSTELTVTMN